MFQSQIFANVKNEEMTWGLADKYFHFAGKIENLVINLEKPKDPELNDLIKKLKNHPRVGIEELRSKQIKILEDKIKEIKDSNSELPPNREGNSYILLGNWFNDVITELNNYANKNSQFKETIDKIVKNFTKISEMVANPDSNPINVLKVSLTKIIKNL